MRLESSFELSSARAQCPHASACKGSWEKTPVPHSDGSCIIPVGAKAPPLAATLGRESVG
jgi:hypothetical protein